MTETHLYPHNIDLHYHAGQERPIGTTLDGHLEHALLTGRKVVGLTDHLEFYIGQPPSNRKPMFTYEQSVAGLLRYREDVDEARGRHPGLRILFGPEMHANKRIDLRQMPQEVVDAADYFHSSLPFEEGSPEASTAARLKRLRDVADLRDRTGRPAFICHPFREPVNWRLVKGPIAEWVTALAPRRDCDFREEEVSRFFGFDVRAVARACGELGLPIEINGGTDARIRALNLPAPLQMLWAAYRYFRDEGAGFVPGSDQHTYHVNDVSRREGRYIPWEPFDFLGVMVDDMPFVKNLLGGKVSC